MKRLLTIFLSFCITSAAHGAFLYFDNFAQFPNGTDLTETNYVPEAWIPAGVYAWTETNDTTGISATTSNLLGSERLFITAPAGPEFHYHANLLTAAVTNQVVSIKWLSWIAATKSATATGFLAVAVSATNGDDNLQEHIPLVVFEDSGSISVFTNAVVTTSFPIVQIGSWSSYAGQMMTNDLELNYPARNFSFSLNATTLTNMPIPGYVTNILGEVGFGVNEEFPSSVGNKFALGDVLLTYGVESISGIRTVGTNVLVSIQSVSNENYQLQFSNSMVPTNWSNVSGASVTSAPGGSLTLTNFGGASSPQRFYRFVIVP